MRLLVFHTNSFGFESSEADATATGATAAAEREDCLAAFVTVETADETAPDAVVASARTEILDLATTLRTDDIVLYPTASLGDDPADAETAGQLLATLEDALVGDDDSGDDPTVVRAPTGWNTSFDLAAKAHPLAEQPREITAADARRDAAETGRPERTVLFPDGTEQSPRAVHDAGDSVSVSAPLRALAAHLDAEQDDEHQPGDSHESRAVARESGLLAPEDSGTTTPRLTPQGTFVRDAVAEYARSVAIEAGAVPIAPATDATVADGTAGNPAASPPIRPAVVSALARMASTTSQPSVVLTATDVVTTGDGRPGQPVGTVRTPEVWTSVTDRPAAWAQLASGADMIRRIADACALDTVPLLRVQGVVVADTGAWIDRLVEALGEPVIVERRPAAAGEWSVELAFVAVVAGQPLETGTIRVRFGNGRTTGGNSKDSEGATDAGVLLCCTPVGPLERATATVGAAATTRDPPRLPTWLAPTQVRLVPADPEKYREACRDIAAALEANGVRVDVDDRDLTVGERLEQADDDWLPYDAVVGGREADGETLAVTVRETGEQIDLTVAELGDRIRDEVGDRPRNRQYLPRTLSERPASRQ